MVHSNKTQLLKNNYTCNKCNLDFSFLQFNNYFRRDSLSDYRIKAELKTHREFNCFPTRGSFCYVWFTLVDNANFPLDKNNKVKNF